MPPPTAFAGTAWILFFGKLSTLGLLSPKPVQLLAAAWSNKEHKSHIGLEGKGNSLVKSSYDLLKLAQDIRFLGNVEGRDLFTGNVDVVVCDGFVGNVALKLSEGLGSSLTHVLKRELLNSGLLPRIGTFLAKKAFKSFARVVDYAEYGGAPLLGLQGVAIVCHGASNVKALTSATTMAHAYVTKGTHERLVSAISANEELTRYARSV